MRIQGHIGLVWEASVEKIGEENMIAVAPASGIRLKAISSMVCEPTCEAARVACARRRRVRNTINPALGRMNAAIVSSATKLRENSTSPIG